MTDIVVDSNPFHPLLSRVDLTHTWIRPEKGGSKHRRYQSLTPKRWEGHLDGTGATRGVCLTKRKRLNGTGGTGGTGTRSSVAVLDFDDHEDNVGWTAMSMAVGRVVDVLEARGAAPVLWRSGGGKGVHLYLMWEQEQDNRSIKAWLCAVLESVGLKSGPGGVIKGQVEVFPKNDTVIAKMGTDKAGNPDEEGWGNMIWLPGSRDSIPLVRCDLSDMLVERPGGVAGWTAADWVVLGESENVPVVEAPARVRSTSTPAAGLGDLHRSAMDAMATKRAALPRDAWRNAIFAIHHETGGSEEGREEAIAWSGSLPGADEGDAEALAELWAGASSEGEGRITGATLLALARQYVGWVDPIDATEFTSVERPRKDPPPTVAGMPQELTEDPDTYVRDKAGKILPTTNNAIQACRVSTTCGKRIARDDFVGQVMLAEPGSDAWTPMTDNDNTKIRAALEAAGFKGTVSRDLVSSAVNLVAGENRFDSAQIWLQGVKAKWDGVRRIDRFYVDRFGVEDSPYVRAVARYTWTALAGRVMEPGCKADMAMIFVGAQGVGKTTAIQALVPDRKFFTEVDLGDDNEKNLRKTKGTLVGEMSEMSGLKTKAREQIKAYISREVEEWTPKYQEHATSYPRRFILFGSSNDSELLNDPTGHRRWLPLHVGARIDVESIKRDLEQLWAEGALMWGGKLRPETGLEADPAVEVVKGVRWFEAQKLAKEMEVHKAFEETDTWEDPIVEWLDQDVEVVEVDGKGVKGVKRVKRAATAFKLADLLQGALHMTSKEQLAGNQSRAARVLKGLGFKNKNNGKGMVWSRAHGN